MLIVFHLWCRSTVNETELDLTDIAANVRSFVQEYRNGQLDTRKSVSLEGLETRAHVSTAIQGTTEAIESVAQDVSKLALIVDVQVSKAKREHLLQSLKYPGFNERRNEVREAHPDTFQWVFAGDGGTSDATESDVSAIKWDSFSNWLKSTDTVYWISGKPGSGKSTMVKYILAKPQIEVTKQCLNVWSPGCLIISHYFWRPGNPMQRSIKGLFCSLLHQLLGNNESALARALASDTGPSMKTDVTDWSLEELQSTLLRTVEGYDHPICIFLDGLDEVYPDQPTALLDMIMKFPMAGKTKMCLASRAEPPLQRRLYDMPQLRLQDLTAADLTKYVRDHMQPSDFDFAWEWKYESFVTSLVERAQGVFLWLVLVTKSIRNGFENGDSSHVIEERVDHLKGGDLESLYNDMWDRVSDNNPDTYRRTAAVYFRIMLLYNRECNSHLHFYGENLSVFTMMFATTGLAEKTLDAAPLPLDLVLEGELLECCKEVERIAETYCFGLLEVSQQSQDEIIDNMTGWYGASYDRLLVYAQARKALVFIHRSAVDFLMGTAQGREILSFDDTAESSHAFQIVAANLAHAQLFCDPAGKAKAKNDERRLSLVSHHLVSIRGTRDNYIAAHESVTADYTRMMMHCKRLCDLEQVFAGLPSRALVCSGVDFFKAVAMYCVQCLDVFEDQIKALDKETRSEILQILCHRFCFKRYDGTQSTVHTSGVLEFVNLLLREGADPNWNGIAAFSQPVLYAETHICRQTPFVTMISQMLQVPSPQKHRLFGYARDFHTESLVTLETFIRCGANLDGQIALLFLVDAQPSTVETPDTCQDREYRPLFPGDDIFREDAVDPRHKDGYVCLVPGHKIIDLLVSEWEPLERLPPEEQVFSDVTSSIACSTSNHSRNNGTVLARLELNGSNFPLGSRFSPDWEWGPASPGEYQERISKELMRLITLSGSSVDEFQGKQSAPTQAIGYETLTSMRCGFHRVETRVDTPESIYHYLIDIGVFAKLDISTRELHSIEDWMKLKGILHRA